ncbi:unnamed protein product [Adineta steineri]|uniref:Voltage-dependent anion-selective channel protein 3 n=1 Tax=Adineta steineri TaxID=433720 RepID=A0A815BUQ9_9BILA|nr:unnamed protein product [Adineta steineri]
MAPPKFSDLNKQVSDIFNKGYFFNVFKLDVKTRTANGVNFNVVGEHNTETAQTTGSLETKYVVPEYGLTFLEKWNTNNLLKCEITADNQLAQGFKVVFDATLIPNTGNSYEKIHFGMKTRLLSLDIISQSYTAKLQIRVRTQVNKLRLTGSYTHSGNDRYWKKTAELRTAYTHDKAHVETNVAFDSAGPILNGAVVLGHQGWLAGYQYVFNTARSALTKNNFAVGFRAKDFTLYANIAGPILNGAVVLGHQGWLAGYQYVFNTARSALTKNNFAVGFRAKDFTLYANMNDSNEVGGSVYQRINDRLETGVQLAWTAGSNQTRFALASKYQLDAQTVVSAKVNNICQVGLSFAQVLRPGVKLTLSALFEAKNLNAGGHKVGLGLELDA